MPPGLGLGLGLGRSLFGPSWWGCLEPSWGYLGPSWGHLGTSWGPLVSILGLSWALLGLSWAILGLSWAILGLSQAILEPSWPIWRVSTPKNAVSSRNRLEIWGPLGAFLGVSSRRNACFCMAARWPQDGPKRPWAPDLSGIGGACGGGLRGGIKN